MKKLVSLALLVVMGAAVVHAEPRKKEKADSARINADGKKEIIKTGYNFGPLPAIAYDADKGFQLGAILQVFNYGDGHSYPNYISKMYFEASWFTKGSMLFQARYDNKELIPGVRWSSSARITIDKAFDFYGFNGYKSYFDQSLVSQGKDKKNDMYIFTPFYRQSRQDFLFKSDFQGTILPHFKWEAGLFFNYQIMDHVNLANINKGKKDGSDGGPDKRYPTEGSLSKTLFDYYVDNGVISASEADGGYSTGLRLGLDYDTRDKEGAPSKGIWAEGHVTLAPKYLAKNPYYRYSLTFRHYVPIVKNDVLTFAYRLNYEGTFGKQAPFYALNYITNMGEKCDLEGMGGYNTVRGVMRCRVVGLDMATWNVEFRYRFINFTLGKQNIAFALNLFSDGSMVTRGRDISALATVSDDRIGLVTRDLKEIPHATVGAGLRFIMNNNFIVAAEYGSPVSHWLKNTNPYKDQDGTGAFYLNIGYLF